MRLKLPPKVQYIIEKLNGAGFEAYAVGGCVRDSILGRQPDDWDITTSAKPLQVKELFARTVDTGLQHGTVTVLLDKDSYEVTTYRIDGEYLDGRHPRQVEFTSRLEEDLQRRDFTINAMAYSRETGLVDCFQGMKDMQLHRVRCVGEPRERFSEDALRILRAVRFAAQLGFGIEERTREAIRQLAPTLEKISAERIRVELNKLLISPRPQLLREAWELGITAVVLPEFDRAMDTPQNVPEHFCTVGEHTLRALELVEAAPVLRWTMLLHDLAKPQVRTTGLGGIDYFPHHQEKGEQLAVEVLRRLRFDNETVRRVRLLVRWHDVILEPQAEAVRRAVSQLGRELFPLYLQVRRADILAQRPLRRQEKLSELARVEELFAQILERGDCLAVKELAVNGKDLMALGLKPGPGLGETLERLLDLVLEDPQRNTREYLLKTARDIPIR